MTPTRPRRCRVHASLRAVAVGIVVLLIVACAPDAMAADAPDVGAGLAWWVWPLALFVVCFALGIVAVPAGVGGGVLFVPIVGGFFPFHLDFVRGAGLLVALASALAAGPNLLRVGLADLRLALPLAVLASASSIVGALVGLALPSAMVQTALGITILAIVALMASAKKSEFPEVPAPDRLSAALAHPRRVPRRRDAARTSIGRCVARRSVSSSSPASACSPGCSASAPAGPTCRC